MSEHRGYDSKRSWQAWVQGRLRPLSFACAMLVALILLMLFGPSK